MKDKIREICYDLEIGCIDWTEASEQLFALCDVSQHRELLIAFAKYMEEDKMYARHDEANADDFLENYSN